MSNGCRVDNGRCLARLAKPAGESWAVLQFGDGSVYRVSPVADADLLKIATLADQPGCWFNYSLSKDGNYNYQKLAAFPQVPDSGWLSIIW